MRYTAIILLLILIGYLLFNPINISDAINNIGTSKNFDFYKGLSLLITSAISLINFFMVFVFFYLERKFKIQQLDFERKSFWYRKIIIEKKIDDLNAAFTALCEEKKYDTSLEESVYVSQIRLHIKECKKIIIEINDTLRILDLQLYKKINIIVEDLEDGFMKKAEQFYNSKGKIDLVLDFVKQQRIQLIEILFKYEVYNYKHTENMWQRLGHWFIRN